MDGMRLIDTHCHLNNAEAFPDPAATIRQAAEAGVERLVVVGIDEEWNRSAVELAERHANVYAVVGWHPNSAREYGPEARSKLRVWLEHPKVVALGEVGLDFHWNAATREEQDRCLSDQLDLAEELAMPVVFHCREAWPELLTLLESRKQHPWLFHCFSGTADDARRAAALGGYLGFDGPITYPKAEESRAILRDAPRDKIVLETDSPWLAPAPYRGRPNHPALLVHINAKAAEVLGLDEASCAELTWRNASSFFGLPD